jgi:hypothetical protein
MDYGVRAAEFGVIGEVTFWTFRQVLGDLYDTATHTAWAKIMSKVLDIMVPAAVDIEFRHQNLSQNFAHQPHLHTYSYKMARKQFIMQNMSGKVPGQIPLAAVERAERLRADRVNAVCNMLDSIPSQSSLLNVFESSSQKDVDGMDAVDEVQEHGTDWRQISSDWDDSTYIASSQSNTISSAYPHSPIPLFEKNSADIYSPTVSHVGAGRRPSYPVSKLTLVSVVEDNQGSESSHGSQSKLNEMHPEAFGNLRADEPSNNAILKIKNGWIN